MMMMIDNVVSYELFAEIRVFLSSLIIFFSPLQLFVDFGSYKLEDKHSDLTTHSIHILQFAFIYFQRLQVISLFCIIVINIVPSVSSDTDFTFPYHATYFHGYAGVRLGSGLL